MTVVLDFFLRIFAFFSTGLGATIAAGLAILVGAFALYRYLTRTTYDVFLAIPMAANPKDEAAFKALSHDLVACFQTDLNLHRIYCAWLRVDGDDSEESVRPAGGDDESDADGGGKWDSAQIALPDVRNALKCSKYFVLVYPEKIVSSVLVEAGMALGFEKPSVWFVRDKDHLPYLLKKGEGASERDGIPSIKIYVIKELRHIKGLLRTHKNRIFGASTWQKIRMLVGLDQS